MQHLIDGFEKSHPGITVKYVGVTSSEIAEKYNTAIASGSTPDVGGVTTALLASLTAQKALAKLDDRYAGSPLNGKLSANFLTISRSAAAARASTSCRPPATRTSSGTAPTSSRRPPRHAQDLGRTLRRRGEVDRPVEEPVRLHHPRRRYSGFQILSEAYAYSGLDAMFDANGTSTVADPRNIALIEKIAAQYKATTPEADVSNAYPQMLAQFQAGQVMTVHHNLGSTRDVRTALGDKVAGMLLPAARTAPPSSPTRSTASACSRRAGTRTRPGPSWSTSTRTPPTATGTRTSARSPPTPRRTPTTGTSGPVSPSRPATRSTPPPPGSSSHRSTSPSTRRSPRPTRSRTSRRCCSAGCPRPTSPSPSPTPSPRPSRPTARRTADR
ncbi:extracellular solute-binding protein [Kitasatospora arboriphila]